MDLSDKELKEQLGRDPFARAGFDEELKKKIRERIDAERGGRRSPRRFAWRLPAAAFASFALILLGIWLWNGPLERGRQSEEAIASPVQASTPVPTALAAPKAKQYALLIGLRTDRKESASFPTSRYRTVLVAPKGSDPDELGLMADNAGLYMPYGQNFWHIAAVESADGRQTLQAIQATNRKSSKPDAAVAVPDYLLSERVLYAGNAYLAVESTVKDGQGAPSVNWWVKHINQINLKAKTAASEPHTALRDLFPNAEPSVAGVQQWSVSRNPGQWIAVSKTVDGLPSALPSQLVQHDVLTMSWEDIQAIEPGAQDAFTYGNVLGVVTGREIRVHAVREGKSVSPSTVSIPLGAGESVVMVQWAQDGYVQRWISYMRGL